MTERSPSPASPIPDKLLEEGAIWFARMRGPDAGDFQGEFENWLNREPLHQSAYERAGEIFAMGRFLAAERAGRGNVANDNAQRHGRSTWISVAAALAIGIAMIAFIYLGRSQVGKVEPSSTSIALDGPQTERYVAGSGSTLAVRLPDGSTATLEAGSVLTRKFGADRRELRLEGGMARFDVAHEKRPFVVLAGGGSVTARGTIFDVRLTADNRVSVNLVRGVIDIERPRQADGTVAPLSRLGPGESLAFTSKIAEPVPTLDRSSLALATKLDKQQPREFDRTPLIAVIAEVRSASGETILLSDPSLGQLRVSGRFRIDDSEQVAEQLSALFGLEVVNSASGEVTLRQPS